MTVKVRAIKEGLEQLGFNQTIVLKKGIYFTGETRVAKIVQHRAIKFQAEIFDVVAHDSKIATD